jgi:hypothetical protein
MAIIAPGITNQDYASQKVSALDVFEGRIKGWTLAFAKIFAEHEHSGLSILLLTASVIEPMGGALTGGGKAGAKFRSGFVKIFPDIPGGKSAKVAELVCDLLRDGLFHEGFIKAGLILERGDVPVRINGSAVVIDPVRFLAAVDTAFTKLCEEIRSDAQMQKTFMTFWNKKDENHRRYMENRPDPQIDLLATSTSTLAPMPAPIFFKTKL